MFVWFWVVIWVKRFWFCTLVWRCGLFWNVSWPYWFYYWTQPHPSDVCSRFLVIFYLFFSPSPPEQRPSISRWLNFIWAHQFSNLWWWAQHWSSLYRHHHFHRVLAIVQVCPVIFELLFDNIPWLPVRDEALYLWISEFKGLFWQARFLRLIDSRALIHQFVMSSLVCFCANPTFTWKMPPFRFCTD